MLILGWHGSPENLEGDDIRTFVHHDAAAAIVKDGRIIAAIEEERLSRVKHSNSFPYRAIAFCLKEADASIADLDAIVTDCSEHYYDVQLQRQALADPRELHEGIRSRITRTFERVFDVDIRSQLRFCNHHWAHLHAAWHPSGFPDALGVCLDGDGDGDSGLIAYCSRSSLRILAQLSDKISLGNFYTAMMSVLGYQRFDEYKVMGLAPYGNRSEYESLFRGFYRLLPGGRYEFSTEEEIVTALSAVNLIANARRNGEPFSQKHKDFAASLQSTLETIVQHVVDHFQSVTQTPFLCLSGGVAHNCAMNGTLLRSGQFKDIYVHPACHDAGNAVGAALSIMSEAGIPFESSSSMRSVYSGSNVGSSDEIGERLNRWSDLITFKRISNVAACAASSLADGSIIGWVQGKSEFGPRALGNRSILADPRPSANKDKINAIIKKREDYRPFAPSVLIERLHEYFEAPADASSFPYMAIVLPVKPEARNALGAVTHIDGTARVQTVNKSDNALFYALISEFDRLVGLPVLLNTSFNNNAEPIVDSVDDAVGCLLTTGLHEIFVGDWRVQKQNLEVQTDSMHNLVPEVGNARKLVRRRRNAKTLHFIESTYNRYFGESRAEISRQLYDLLVMSNDDIPLGVLFQKAQIDGGSRSSLYSELLDLWSRRMVALVPLCPAAVAKKAG
jgi:carbamoyltransferase